MSPTCFRPSPELAGVPAPLGIDGVSLAPALLGSGYQRLRRFLIHEAGNGQSIIRGGVEADSRKNRTRIVPSGKGSRRIK